MKNEENKNEDGKEAQAYCDDGNGTDAIRKYGAVTTRGAQTIRTIAIIGQIEGHFVLPDGQKATKYEHLIPELVAVEESEDVEGLLLILNTMGGDVEAGLALSELISSMKKPTVSLVLGGGHSIAVPLAVSARKSFIAKSATMTLHPVRISGVVIGAPQTFRTFSDMQHRIVRFICEHSTASDKKIEELMMRPDQIANDMGTVLESAEAVRIGLIDRIGGLSDAMAELRAMIAKEKKNSTATDNEENDSSSQQNNSKNAPLPNA